MKIYVLGYLQPLNFFFRLFGWRLVVTTILGLALAVLDGIGIALFLAALNAINSNSHVVTFTQIGEMGAMLNWIPRIGIELTITNTLIVILVLYCIKGVTHFAVSYCHVLLGVHFLTQMRIVISRQIAGMWYRRFIEYDPGKIQNLMSTEVARALTAFNHFFGALQTSILVIVYAVLALAANPRFALFVAIGAGIASMVYHMIDLRIKGMSHQATLDGHKYHSLLLESAYLYKYLKATATSRPFCDRLVAKVMDLETVQKDIGFLNALMGAIREPFVISMIVLIIIIEMTLLRGAVSSVLLSILFFYRALGNFMVMQTSYSGFVQNSGALDTMQAFREDLASNQEPVGHRPYSRLKESISLDNVTFSYLDDVPLIKDVCLHINRNETIAFVGESGGGKTTLVNLIAGLLRPTTGAVRIDGVDLSDFRIDEYRNTIGYITQEPVIFNDTIYNNITFWAPKTRENLSRFWEACRGAAIMNFVQDSLLQEDTSLGNSGSVMSGGERQRISIARELFRQPEILILDEATSSLDSETENTIQTHIESLRGRCTLVVVAHRLATIKFVDRIFAIVDGQVVGQGSFGELMRESEAFSRMVHLQSFAS